MTLPPEAYLWFKSLHIIGVVVWFAGLFYLVRLFIYHVEAKELDEEIREAFYNQYSLMELRLANIITTPGMILTVSMATGLVVMEPSWLTEAWMQFKLGFVFLLLVYHFFCYRLMNQLKNNKCNWSGRQLRILNEMPTLLLVSVVLLVVFKSSFPTNAATWFIVLLIILMALSIQFYARYRRLSQSK
ncbi:protoporphyrinogen oxidase HemJ [Prochlorococcus marinus]|uniref:Protoporphyrinogen IX oxidase n=1 Tax=Prochlorococcus marinus (strain MIT 9211) TaxID=93059 RepID=A9BAF2_PROM4|nr:protoporphyrinogen oxidase HemJ [Prochlorococcus marinus]ABX08814.1 Predicted membrane protein [Prochlorococcus marinus str. MIT 9211]